MGPAGTETGPTKSIFLLRLWHIQCRAGLCAGLMQTAFSGAGNEIQKLCEALSITPAYRHNRQSIPL